MMLLIASSPEYARSQHPDSSGPVIAKAGGVFVRERELVYRFEMLPALYRHRKARLEQEKLELLTSIIAEKLLSQEALDRQMEHDSVYVSAMLEIRKAFARDELYREEVKQKVHLLSAEIAKGIARSQLELLISFIYTERKYDISFLRAQIRHARDVGTLVIDSSMHAVQDTATVIWGEADPAVEEAAYRLKEGDVSPVVRAGDGYYVLALERVSRNGSYASLSSDLLAARVESVLRARKEEARLNEFTREALHGKVGYALPAALKAMGKALQDLFRTRADSQYIAMDQSMFEEMERRCDSILRDTLCVAGNSHWSVGDVLRKLYLQGFKVAGTRLRSLPGALNAQVKVWVQQELLAQEALDRALDKRPEIGQQLELWSRYYLAGMMKNYIAGHLTVTDSEVSSYRNSKHGETSAPEVQIRELRTNSTDEMKGALLELQNGRSFEQVVERWSNDPAGRKRKGISEYFPITGRPPIGEIASRMDAGQRYGPIPVEGGVLLFELLKKKSPMPAGPASSAKELQAAKDELLGLKLKRTLTLFLAQSGEQRGFEIYQEKVAAITVSPVPMMTFRLLGFGGRIFGVPFVDPQLDWVTTEPPSTPVIP